MALSDGQPVNASATNAAFISRTTDSDTTGKIDLLNADSTNVTDLQSTINDLNDEFDTSTGHDHDGTDSKKVLATNLDSTGGTADQVPVADGAGNVSWEDQSGGGGTGGLDTYLAEDYAETLYSDFSSGNNSTFLGGGTLDGTLADETTSPIAGIRSIKYTMGSSSTDDYFASPVVELDAKQAGNYTYMNLYFTYDGDAEDIKVVLYDVDNTTVISSDADLLTNPDNPTRYSTSVFIPEGVTEVRYGFQVVTGNSGKILVFDDVELSTNPVQAVNLQEENEFSARIDNNGTATITSQGGLDINGNNAVASVNRSAVGVVDVTFTTGFFSVIPSITAICEATGIRMARIESISTSAVQIRTFTTSANSDQPFTLHIDRQGGDYKRESEHIVTPAKSGIEEYEVNGYTSTDGSGNILFKTELFNTLSSLATLTTSSYTRIDALKKVIAFPYVGLVATANADYELFIYNSSNTLLRQMNLITGSSGQASSGRSVILNAGDWMQVRAITSAPTDDVRTYFGVTLVDFEQQILSAIPDPTYSARITNNGTAALTSQSRHFISSVTRTGAGVVDIVYATNFFKVIPAISATVARIGGGGSGIAWIYAESTTGCTIKTNYPTTDTFTDYDFTFFAQKQQ